MAGLLSPGGQPPQFPPGHVDAQAPQNPSTMHNMSIGDLLAFLLKRGLLGGVARTMTPVDPVGNRPIEEALHVRDRQLRDRGLR